MGARPFPPGTRAISSSGSDSGGGDRAGPSRPERRLQAIHLRPSPPGAGGASRWPAGSARRWPRAWPPRRRGRGTAATWERRAHPGRWARTPRAGRRGCPREWWRGRWAAARRETVRAWARARTGRLVEVVADGNVHARAGRYDHRVVAGQQLLERLAHGNARAHGLQVVDGQGHDGGVAAHAVGLRAQLARPAALDQLAEGGGAFGVHDDADRGAPGQVGNSTLRSRVANCPSTCREASKLAVTSG